jgi:hypothetical protein
MVRYPVPRASRRAAEYRALCEDVAGMLKDTERIIGKEADELARDIVTVIRERVLREVTAIARENIR